VALSSQQFEKQRRRLYSRAFVLGGWLRRRAAWVLANDASLKAMRALAEALTRSEDQQVREIALEALRQGDNPQAACAARLVWADTRHDDLVALLANGAWDPAEPPLVRVLSALKIGRLDLVTEAGTWAAAPLVLACEDDDPDISSRAQTAISELVRSKTRRAVANQLCTRWVETRSLRLGDIIARERFVARRPPRVRLLSALKADRRQLYAGFRANMVEFLLEAARCDDATVAANARLALQSLKDVGARDEVCRLVVEQDEPVAREAALAAGYAPQDVYQRALFFFLTGQWERYASLDFDQRMLRVNYESAHEALRQRIREQLQARDGVDFLTVVAGGEHRPRTQDLTLDEAEFLVQELAAQGDWASLWDMVFELPFDWSVYTSCVLASSSWRPQAEDERTLFDELLSLDGAGLLDSREALGLIPLARRRALARVPGRVNDVAFSPLRPVIAVSTGQRRVVSWDFERAERQAVLEGFFEHSVGRVAFTGDDVLLCAERTNSAGAVCSIYAWRGGERLRLGQHVGSVTALEPVGKSRFLSAGRDSWVALWDQERVAEQQRFSSWARAARVSPGGQQAALLHEGLTLISLPTLNFLARGPGSKGVTRHAAFADARTLITGHFGGEVLVSQRQQERLQAQQSLLGQHQGQVQGIEMLDECSIVVTAGSEGCVRFVAWPSQATIGELETTSQQLTSLHVSPDGAFMAMGEADAALSLWDLRTLYLLRLFTRPLAQAGPAHLAAVVALRQEASLPARLLEALRFIERVLRRRLRDVEVGALPQVQAGEFEIEVEG
jgi:WD40 repeat protein